MHWLPVSARIDAFQHWVYDHPQQAMDPRACDHTWAELSRRFLPWVDWSGLDEALRTGWQQVQHIYCFPFYYIEYAIAALGALQIWNNYRQDPRTALQQYRSALALGATKTFQSSLRLLERPLLLIRQPFRQQSMPSCKPLRSGKHRCEHLTLKQRSQRSRPLRSS